MPKAGGEAMQRNAHPVPTEKQPVSHGEAEAILSELASAFLNNAASSLADVDESHQRRRPQDTGEPEALPTASPFIGSWWNKFLPSSSLPTWTGESARLTLAHKSKRRWAFRRKSGWKTPFDGIGKSTRRTKIGGVWARRKCLLRASLFGLHTE